MMSLEQANPHAGSSNIQYHNIPDFSFVSGTTLHDVKVAYRSINPSSSNGVILIPTCFAGRLDTTLTFTEPPNKALSKYHIIVAAMLGNGESSSPSNRPIFPDPGQLQYQDIIHAHYHLLTQGLGVTQLKAVLGFSMGGQQAYHWAILYPNFVQSIVGICTSARTSPHNYAFIEGPVTALESSIDYIAWKQVKKKLAMGENVGEDLSQIKPKRGLSAFARGCAGWLTSAGWYRAQRWKQLGLTTMEDWLSILVNDNLTWDADDLLVLARTWQMGDIGRLVANKPVQLGWINEDNDEDLKNALASIACPVLLMPNRTDQYFRPEESEFEMNHLRHGKLEVIESDWGHMSGGGSCPADAAFMNSKIEAFLAMI